MGQLSVRFGPKRSDFRKGVRGRMKCSPAVPLLTKGDEQGVRKGIRIIHKQELHLIVFSLSNLPLSSPQQGDVGAAARPPRWWSKRTVDRC